MLFYPERVAFAGILAYLALWVVAPLHLAFPVAWGSLGYVFLSYLAFLLGCLIVGRKRLPKSRSNPNQTFRARKFWAWAVIGALGITVRIYDKWILRGAGLGSSALESREILEEAAAGPLSALGGILYPFCFIPLFLWLASPAYAQQRLSRPHRFAARWVAIVLFVLPSIDALLLFSRSQMLVTLAMMYATVACMVYQGQALHHRLRWAFSAGFGMLVAVSIIVFSRRLGEMNLDIVYSILNSGYAYVFELNKFTLQWIDPVNSLFGEILSAMVPMIQYYLHGLFEFGLLWNRPDEQTFSLGAQHFAPYMKIVAALGGGRIESEGDLYLRTGVFTTFFGPLWVDFGWGGLLFMLCFGAVAKVTAQRARAGFVTAMPLHSFFCVVIFFMPVVNFFISAQGIYVVNAFLVFWLVSALQFEKIGSTNQNSVSLQAGIYRK